MIYFDFIFNMRLDSSVVMLLGKVTSMFLTCGACDSLSEVLNNRTLRIYWGSIANCYNVGLIGVWGFVELLLL